MWMPIPIITIWLIRLPALKADPVTWVSCPTSTNALNPQWPATPSALTFNLQSFLTLISKTEFMRDIHFRLRPKKMEIEYKQIRRWERGQGIAHPYPMDSLRNLYWFVSENRLHCHPNALSLAKVLAQVIEVDSEPWQFNPRQFSDEEIENLDTEHSLDRLIEATFQYFTYGPVKHLSILVHLYVDELEQYFEELVASGLDEDLPLLYFELIHQVKEWTTLYYQLDSFIKAVRAFRRSLWTLRSKEAKPKELQRIAEGKQITKPLSISKSIAGCIGRFCGVNTEPRRPDLAA
ncbi:hypothetical protein TWF481_006181 [Arthrobotrys musiformis]|uniref:Uncharacterized protein n=1 Tax=Arthrobotrys musiformis TaxID=47236 RepID=A0AAV9WHY6_9PEZI